MRGIDIVGERFGRLTVIKKDSNKHGKSRKLYWICECECGTIKSICGVDLRAGKTLSCGCYHRERARECNTTHGLSDTRIYNIWCAMKQRCYYKDSVEYKYYGGKGISICDEWRGEHGFENFYRWSIDNGYSDSLTIDRIDLNGDYNPNNCRWVDYFIQENNTSRNVFYEYNGHKKTIGELSRETGINYRTLHSRINKLNMNVCEAINYQCNLAYNNGE